MNRHKSISIHCPDVFKTLYRIRDDVASRSDKKNNPDPLGKNHRISALLNRIIRFVNTDFLSRVWPTIVLPTKKRLVLRLIHLWWGNAGKLLLFILNKSRWTPNLYKVSCYLPIYKKIIINSNNLWISINNNFIGFP